MKYPVFEKIMSPERMSRYLRACSFDSRKAMTLYRLNLKVSQELFTIISCFEIALRNQINFHYISKHGNDWLKTSVESNGIFTNAKCRNTANVILRGIKRVQHEYSHSKLLAEMDFGFWRYLFSQPQYYAAGQSLLTIFPSKPKSSRFIQYNNKFIFNELEKINSIRNRIAHHEPICFEIRKPRINTSYIEQNYSLIKDLFTWMEIDESSMLYGIDHVNQICERINNIQKQFR